MTRLSRILALLGFLAAVGTVIGADAIVPREPVVEGKRLGAWLGDYQGSFPGPEYDGDPRMRARAEAAVLKAGTNAIPWLSVELSAKEATRGDELPTNFYSGKAIGRRWLAATAFEILGQAARDATPTLLLLLDDKQTSYTAAIALGGIGVESIPVLTGALTNTHACARESAARVLGRFGAKAQSAVPALVRCTNDADESVRSFAAFALRQVDPKTAPKAGVK
jgi:HEAT repeat protein